VVYMKIRDREPIQEAVRRFRKLVERSGVKREMRKREYYVKPSDTIRHDRERAVRRAKAAKLEGA
jgi:small subunit ribosomal protein S21